MAKKNNAHKRRVDITRQTNETDIEVEINLDGVGQTDIDTGVPFFDHMLDAFARHGLFDLFIQAMGDIKVDAHHTVEDVGIVMGKAVSQAMGEKLGITRFADCAIPMDEALVLAAIDVSGRGALYWNMDIPVGAIKTFDTQLAREFFTSFAANAGISLHLQQLAGENAHHLIEAAFKACGRALSQAVAINPRIANELPSTKGKL